MENEHRQSGLFPSKEACLFCRIAKKEAASYMVFEDRLSFAFLDTHPLFPGHILLIPKTHYSSMGEMPDEINGTLFKNVKLLGSALEKALDADGCFIAVNDKVSQSQPHLHIHIVPRRFHDGLKGFFWPRYKYKSEEEIKEVQKRIIDALDR
jgi:histidine triad (HIT) family protein